ncbi:hypothetical protein EDD22DRAFT_906451 [Suillus occidentalis]|nr:hypothetical protein EDD22DRAFT_906451 [Suillus occidentalis]
MLCLTLTAMLNCSMRPSLHSENYDRLPWAFGIEAPVLSAHCSAYLIILSYSFVIEVSHKSAIHPYSFALAQIIKYLRPRNYQLPGLHASRTLHLHMYA